ncbi:MAG: DUF4383 domain-containing protein [Ktedonobacteraceae bacterium]
MTNVNKTVALLVGIVFILIGILGYIPGLVPNGALLGIFDVNALHSAVHILFGVLGVAGALTGTARLYNRVVGVVYLLLAVLGFIPALFFNGLLLGLVSINTADNLLHLVIGAVLVIVGFAIQTSHSATAQA